MSLPVAERDIILTYALHILADAGLLERLVFKGGTCIRKVFIGRSGRFSEDLDFTAINISDPEDLILAIAGVFDGQTRYGITFSVGMEDFYVRGDRQACGVQVGYAHEWNLSAQFTLDVSLREKPMLGIRTLPLLSDSYFGHLEFEPPVVATLRLEEIVAEKVRAAYQRFSARDVYDLYQFRSRPLNRNLVRTLTVLKLWLAGDTFDPERFFTGLGSKRYNWGDLARLVRRDRRPETRAVIAGCLEGYAFLRNLSAKELELAKDPHRRRTDLYRQIVRELRV